MLTFPPATIMISLQGQSTFADYFFMSFMTGVKQCQNRAPMRSGRKSRRCGRTGGAYRKLRVRSAPPYALSTQRWNEGETEPASRTNGSSTMQTWHSAGGRRRSNAGAIGRYAKRRDQYNTKAREKEGLVMVYYIAKYLHMCRTMGWMPTISGLKAFSRQIKSGLRNENGQMCWL